jgi:hypothetical protein
MESDYNDKYKESYDDEEYFKQMRKERRKEIIHNMLLIFLVVFSLYAAYFLFYGLIFEPALPGHVYGPGDLTDAIYLGGCLLVVAISYLGIVLLKYKPLKSNLWKNFLLLRSVKFDIEEYILIKRFGIYDESED